MTGPPARPARGAAVLRLLRPVWQASQLVFRRRNFHRVRCSARSSRSHGRPGWLLRGASSHSMPSAREKRLSRLAMPARLSGRNKVSDACQALAMTLLAERRSLSSRAHTASAGSFHTAGTTHSRHRERTHPRPRRRRVPGTLVMNPSTREVAQLMSEALLSRLRFCFS